ncbi:MAG TPA: signal peptidase I [Vicinamibacterales bacterium]|nr:signal peptidase I [Vicinamibacterales bacterium]
MSDSQDPYTTPPAPDRFQPPRADGPEPFQLRPDEPYRPSIEPEGGLPAADAPAGDHRLSLGEALPPLDPLPATAGNFGSAAANVPALDGGSLSSRLVDEFVAWLKTLASAAVYATLIVTFGFQVARVEGQSMAPTLQDQDRLIVNKFAYLSAIGEPQLGDIVMLYYPHNPDKSFVKRVIARADQRVRIVGGKVYVNDVPVDDSFVPEQYRSHEDWGPEVVPEGYYFVMGDHRNNSSDSRHWGFVPKKYIIGRVQLRWWPVPEARTF